MEWVHVLVNPPGGCAVAVRAKDERVCKLRLARVPLGPGAWNLIPGGAAAVLWEVHFSLRKKNRARSTYRHCFLLRNRNGCTEKHGIWRARLAPLCSGYRENTRVVSARVCVNATRLV